MLLVLQLLLLLQAEAARSLSGDGTSLQALAPKAGDGRRLLTVELMNGLGNQLFQAAALLSLGVERQEEVAVALPDIPRVCCNRSTYWHSVMRKLRPLLQAKVPQQPPDPVIVAGKARPPAAPRGKCVLRQVKAVDPWRGKCSGAESAAAYEAGWAARLPACSTVRMYGLFQNARFFAPHLGLLQGLFWDEATAAAAARKLALLAKGRSTVSLHYRLGDYDANGWVLASDYYDRAMEKIADNATCLIFSDEPQRAWRRSEGLQSCGERLLVQAGAEESFYMMALTDVSVLADSSYAYWAALLGPRKRLVLSPKLEGDCWAYLQRKPSPKVKAEWTALPARLETSAQLFAEEVLGLSELPDALAAP